MSVSHFEDEFVKYGGVEAQLLSIDSMDGHDFEHWSAGLLQKIGFCRVEVTPGSGDQGVDILAEKDGVKYAIQCKRYSHDLGNTPVQEVHAGKSMYNCHVGAVLTNQHFTLGAKELARVTGTFLWDRDWLKANLQKLSCGSMSYPSLDNSSSDADGDPLLSSAVDIVLETGQASVSMLQRRLNLGYARAARIVDEMEEKGFVGPFQGAKPRSILITKEAWYGTNDTVKSSVLEFNVEPVSNCDFPKVAAKLPAVEPVLDYALPKVMVEFPEERPLDFVKLIVSTVRSDAHDSCSVSESEEPSFWQKMFGLLKRVVLSIIAWFDLLFFFTSLGELWIGTPSKDWHFIYIIVLMLFTPVVFSLWVLVNKKGPSHIFNKLRFWLLLFMIALLLFASTQ